jgi:hypothetical protein
MCISIDYHNRILLNCRHPRVKRTDFSSSTVWGSFSTSVSSVDAEFYTHIYIDAVSISILIVWRYSLDIQLHTAHTPLEDTMLPVDVILMYYRRTRRENDKLMSAKETPPPPPGPLSWYCIHTVQSVQGSRYFGMGSAAPPCPPRP